MYSVEYKWLLGPPEVVVHVLHDEILTKTNLLLTYKYPSSEAVSGLTGEQNECELSLE